MPLQPIKLEAVLHDSWAQLRERFVLQETPALIAATPFQHGSWLQAWYDTLGAQPAVEPLPLEIRNAQTGRAIFGVPLVRRQVANRMIVEFADCGLTDYNAPLVATRDKAAFSSVSPIALHSLLTATFADVDQLRFVKMPRLLRGQPNPFALLPGATDSALGSNQVIIDGSWSSYRKRLTKKVRKELERSFRVFERDGCNARFRLVQDTDEALTILERMELLQADRMHQLKLPFVLNEPEFAAFYRRLFELDLPSGRLTLSVLQSDPDELVAALLGIKDDHRYAMVRLAHAGSRWSQCSPGKLIIDRTMASLHDLGVTEFDFTTGDYHYKKGFLPKRDALVDVICGVSMSGHLARLRQQGPAQVKAMLRRFPRLYSTLRGLARVDED